MKLSEGKLQHGYLHQQRIDKSLMLLHMDLPECFANTSLEDVIESFCKSKDISNARIRSSFLREADGFYQPKNQYTQRVIEITPIDYSGNPLTIEGINWVEAYKAILERVYSKQAVAASTNTNMYERTRQSIKESGSWRIFQNDPTLLDIADLAALLRCTATSPQETWKSRILDLKRAAEVLADKDLAEFARVIELKVIKGVKNNDR